MASTVSMEAGDYASARCIREISVAKGGVAMIPVSTGEVMQADGCLHVTFGGYDGLTAAVLNNDRFREGYEILNASTLELTEFSVPFIVTKSILITLLALGVPYIVSAMWLTIKAMHNTLLVTVLNYSDKSISPNLKIADGYRIEKILYGSLENVPACDGVILRMSLKEKI